MDGPKLEFMSSFTGLEANSIFTNTCLAAISDGGSSVVLLITENVVAGLGAPMDTPGDTNITETSAAEAQASTNSVIPNFPL